MNKLNSFSFLVMALLMVASALGCASKNKDAGKVANQTSFEEKTLQDSLKKAEEDSIRQARRRERNYLPDDSIKSKYDFAFFNSDGNIIISQFNEDPYSRNLFPEKWGLIDRNGKEIADGRTTTIIPVSYERNEDYIFQNPKGFTHFYTKGKGHGLFDKNYKVKVEPIYDDLDLYEEYAVVKLKGQNERQVLDLSSNKLLFSLPENVRVLNASEGMILTQNSQNEQYFLDLKGKVAIPADKLKKYDMITAFSEGYATVVTSDQLLGFIDKTGKEVIAPFYEYIYDEYPHPGFKDGLAIVEKNEHYGLISKTEDIVVPFIYEEMYRDKNGNFVAYSYEDSEAKPRRIGIDKNGREYTKNYKPTDPTDDWKPDVEIMNGLHGYKDFSGKEVLPKKYFQGTNFNHGMAIVGIGNTLHLIDSKGNIILKNLGRRSAWMLPG